MRVQRTTRVAEELLSICWGSTYGAQEFRVHQAVGTWVICRSVYMSPCGNRARSLASGRSFSVVYLVNKGLLCTYPPVPRVGLVWRCMIYVVAVFRDMLPSVPAWVFCTATESVLRRFPAWSSLCLLFPFAGKEGTIIVYLCG